MFLKGNGSFGAYVVLQSPMQIDITAGAVDSEWVLLGPRIATRSCSPYSVGIAFPFIPAFLARGNYLMLADAAFETELGFGTIHGGDDFASNYTGAPWNGTVYRNPVNLSDTLIAGWQGSEQVTLARPGVVLVAVGTFDPVVTPLSTATIMIGACASQTRAFDTGYQPYPAWQILAAFVPPGSLDIQVRVDGQVGTQGPLAYVTIVEGEGLSELLAP